MKENDMTISTDMTAKKLLNNLNKNVAIRITYEQEKNAELLVSKLINYCKLDRTTFKTRLTETFFQKLLDANAIDSFEFINNHVKENQRFNIYAIEKLMQNLACVAADKLIIAANKYDVACVLTLLQNRDKDTFSFDRDHAKAMLSQACRYEHVALTDLATKFNVSQSTADTQVSSTFRALEAMQILKFTETKKERSVVESIDYDNVFVKLVQRAYKIV